MTSLTQTASDISQMSFEEWIAAGAPQIVRTVAIEWEAAPQREAMPAGHVGRRPNGTYRGRKAGAR